MWAPPAAGFGASAAFGGGGCELGGGGGGMFPGGGGGALPPPLLLGGTNLKRNIQATIPYSSMGQTSFFSSTHTRAQMGSAHQGQDSKHLRQDKESNAFQIKKCSGKGEVHHMCRSCSYPLELLPFSMKLAGGARPLGASGTPRPPVEIGAMAVALLYLPSSSA